MKKMIIYELRKLMGKRIVLLGILAVFVLNILFAVTTYRNMYAFDGSGREGTGMEAIAIDKELARKYEGALTDAKVQSMLAEFRPTSDLHGMNVKYLYQNSIQSAVHARFADLNGGWNGLTVADVYGGDTVQVAYVNGWLNVSGYMARVLVILNVLLIFMAAPAFAGDYGGVDSLILSARYGHTRCATAKNVAALMASLGITAAFVLFNLIFALAVYGGEGLGGSILFAPVEFSEGYIPYNMTCATLILWQSGLALLCAAAVTGITLLISAVCKSPAAAMIVSMGAFLLPFMIPVSETNPLYRLLLLNPVFYVQFLSVMSAQPLGNGSMYAGLAVPAAMIVTALGVFASRRVFAGHQVS